MKEIVYLAGFPRSGSTVLANVLAMHPEITSTPSSPLCSIVQSMRKQWSDDPFLLAQLDDNFEGVHERLKRSTMAFMQAWSEEHPTPIVVDKNRGWLNGIEWLRELDPDFKLIITLRDLRDVYTSVEKRHRKTLFLDFPDHMEHNFVDVRANSLFNDGGIVGSILKGIQNIGDVPNIAPHIYYWRFEDFVDNPQQITDHLFDFLGVEPHEIDFDNIVQSTQESDSYYRMKYLHKISDKVSKPSDHTQAQISPRILKEIEGRFMWFFQQFYPEGVPFGQRSPSSMPQNMTDASVPPVETDIGPEDEVMIQELEKNIQAETN
jgi:sulfotransferase